MAIRGEVRALCELGVFPSEQDDFESGEKLAEVDRLLRSIKAPVTDEEAQMLIKCFGDDNCFGMAWTLLHLVETAPTPPVTSEPPDGANMWVQNMWNRYKNTLED